MIVAFFNSPWRILFGIVTKFDKFSRELLTPDFTGEGRTLYALATGWNIAPSITRLKANVALFIFSKQSLTSAQKMPRGRVWG